MKWSSLLIYSLVILTSCHGQNTTAENSSATNHLHKDSESKLSTSIWIVFQAANGDYWFGSDTDGAYRYDGKSVVHYSEKDGLSSDRIRGFQEDQKGNIYISTLENIQRYDGRTFTTLTAIRSESSSDNWKLQEGDLWFNTLGKNGENGPYRYDGKNLYQLKFPRHYMEDEYFKRFPAKAWRPYDVYQIYKDSRGTMWFGTSNFGICRYDGQSWSWLYEDHLTNTPQGGSFGIRSILEDDEGQFWFCNTRYRYTIYAESVKENGQIMVKYDRAKGMDGIRTADGNDHIYFMSSVKDNGGDIWMATYNNGVWRYDGERSNHYPVKDGDKDITLFSIYKDINGGLWLGTHEAGVYKWNGTTFEKFKL